MIFRAVLTPPMSETKVLGAASSALQISELAVKVSVRLFALSRTVQDAIEPIEALSQDVASIGAILNQLGVQLKKGKDVQVGSSNLVTSVEDLLEECSNILESMERALDDDNTGCKVIYGLKNYVHFASLEPQLVLLETNLKRLKTPLALMLNVLIYAAQLRSHKDVSILKDQQDLIRVLNEERKARERRYHKLTTEAKHKSEEASVMKELPPRPKTPEEGPTEQQTQPRGRVWIKEESPDREYRPTENGLSTSRGSSVTGPTAVNVHGRLQNLYITRNVPVVQDRQDDDSTLVDMASFLKSTGPDTPSSSGEEYFDRPVKPCRPRSQYQARDPVVRGDSSDLINFFREGSPRLRRNGSTKIHGNGTPVRRATAPIFTPLHTGREEFEQKSPQPPKNPSMMTPIRSHSLSLPSPLGSHPPEPQIDAFQPSTPKWPLHSVISWLEKNSFSPEWQQTFRVLQIQGQDFVALGSGQSIRKMLSVIYPQVAREYSENGKTWDDEQGRAEGQRLRKLIRELPVADKYEDDEQGAKGMIAIRPAARPSIVATGRRRVITTPTEATAPTTSEAQARSGQDGPNDIPIQESEEEHSTPYSTPPQTTAGIGHTHSSSVDSKSSNVSDEWVRKWTLLSPAEIARGKVVAAI